MEKSVAKVNGQSCRILELEEVHTLVRTLGTDVQAARDRLRIHQEKCEKLSSEIEVSQICESAGFMRKVSTILPNHSRCGWWIWRKDKSCRQYTLPRDHQDSEPTRWISGHTRIDPVRQVKIMCCFDQYGFEIQVPSTSRRILFLDCDIQRPKSLSR